MALQNKHGETVGCKNSQIRGVYISPLRFKVESLSGVFHICADWMGMFEVSFGWSNILHDSVQRVLKFWDSSGFGLKKNSKHFFCLKGQNPWPKRWKNRCTHVFAEFWEAEFLVGRSGTIIFSYKRGISVNVPPLTCSKALLRADREGPS